ncbi:hypothetical protein MNBD_GAMMA22-2615 [hydrothermal vent metagenome]|uniref:Uncharacterized protein n=1 Tax=hydrothermal vent metagenome TaxID=652676 RepID=A0A3B0ZUI5_9ZZZZ
MKYSFVLLGALFGFLLSRSGATSPDFYANLFLFIDLQLLWVIVAAVIVGIFGIGALKIISARSIIGNIKLTFDKRPMQRGLVYGALLFGVGWGMTGSCPGTVPAMIGEGQVLPIFTLIGIVLGTYVFDLRKKH